MMHYKSVFCIFLIHLINLFENTHTEEILVVEGQVALLPCTSASKSLEPTVKTTLLRWFHNNFYKPVYTLDVRHINQPSPSHIWSDSRARHFPSPDSEGRLYLELSSEIPSLRIDPVYSDDNGSYTCQVEFKFNRTESSTIDLRVIVPPKGVVIRDQKDRKVEGVIGPFNLGETLIITCESLGGDPQPLLSWTGAFDNSSSNYHVNTTNTTSSIIIPYLQRSDQWTHFTCTATNSNLTAPKSATVTIEINHIKMVKNFREPLSVDDQITFECLSFGSHPRAHIRWCIEGVAMDSKDVVTGNGNITTSYHQRRISSQDDGKELVCIVNNPNIPSLVLKQSHTLIVLYKPEILINIQDVSSNSITEDSNVTINCNIRSNPKRSEAIWFFEGNNILNSPNMQVRDEKLSIHGMKRTHAGNYTCEAANSEGFSKASIYVDVKYAPVCQDIEISAKHSDEHNKDVANVTCNLLSNPGNVTFYWMTRNSSSNHTWSTGLDSYTLVELDESIVELLCWGRNAVGLQKSACTMMCQDPTEDHFDINTIFIITFVALISFVIFLVTCRKILHQNDQKDSTVENKQVIGLKAIDKSCGQILNNCVKSTNTSHESDCLTNLLPLNQSKDTKEMNKTFSSVQKVSKIELSELTEQNEEIESLLEWAKYEKRRRIRSSLF